MKVYMKENSKFINDDFIFDAINMFLLSIILIITVYPLIYTVSASLSDPMEILNARVWLLPKGFTLDAYKRVFSYDDIMVGYINTIKYTFVGVIVNIIMTIAGAYPLSIKSFYGKKAITLFLTFTMFFSGGLIPTYMIIKKLGLVNSFWVMILPVAVSMWNIIITRTFFQNSIPYELHEAAYIDGCSDIGILMKIVLPLSTPIIAVMVIFYGVGHWNAFFNALIYLSDRKRYPLQLVLREILIINQAQDVVVEDGQTMFEMVMMAEKIKYAVIVVSSLPVLLMYPMAQRFFVKGVMIGAIKG